MSTVAATAAVILAAACGGEPNPEEQEGSGEQEQSQQPRDEGAQAERETDATQEQETVAALVDSFYQAVDDADGDAACDLLNDSMEGFYAEEGGDCPTAIEGVHDNLDDENMSAIEVDPADVDVSGGSATLSADDIAEANDRDRDTTDGFEFTEEDGEWVISYIS